MPERNRLLMINKLLALAVLLLAATGASAQIQIGSIKGAVTDPTGSVVADAVVWLTNSITGEKIERVTDGAGGFAFNNVPFNRYTLRVEAKGFAPQSRQVTVNSNLPLELSVGLRVAGSSEQIVVTARDNLVGPESTSSATTLAANFIGRAPRVNRGRQLQELVATAPGMATENNGLVHVRGIDDGILYVLDGIPIVDRMDAVSASPIDTDTINSMQVITGNIPAEFGGRSGAVVIVHPKSGIDSPMVADLTIGAGDLRTDEVSAGFGGRVKRN